jgi:hypothetical protein
MSAEPLRASGSATTPPSPPTGVNVKARHFAFTCAAVVNEVDYPRAVGQSAVLREDKIVILRWSNSSYVTCTLTYDPKSAHLIATTSHGTFTPERMK